MARFKLFAPKLHYALVEPGRRKNRYWYIRGFYRGRKFEASTGEIDQASIPLQRMLADLKEQIDAELGPVTREAPERKSAPLRGRAPLSGRRGRQSPRQGKKSANRTQS